MLFLTFQGEEGQSQLLVSGQALVLSCFFFLFLEPGVREVMLAPVMVREANCGSLSLKELKTAKGSRAKGGWRIGLGKKQELSSPGCK